MVLIRYMHIYTYVLYTLYIHYQHSPTLTNTHYRHAFDIWWSFASPPRWWDPESTRILLPSTGQMWRKCSVPVVVLFWCISLCLWCVCMFYVFLIPLINSILTILTTYLPIYLSRTRWTLAESKCHLWRSSVSATFASQTSSPRLLPLVSGPGTGGPPNWWWWSWPSPVPVGLNWMTIPQGQG